MSWNYRVLKQKYTDPKTGAVEYSLGIHEVYYDKEGKPNGYTEDEAVVVISEDEGIETLGEILGMMRKALTLPVLTPEDCGGESNAD